MTQAPKEYIITENLIKVILMQVNRDVEMDEDEYASLAEALRSRPAPASDEEFDKQWRIHGSILRKVMAALRNGGNRALADELELDGIKSIYEPQWIVDHGKCPRDQRTGGSER